MWPCPEGALVCEEIDEPLNEVTCPKAQSGLAHSHHAPPAPQAPPGAGVTDTDVGAKRLFPPPFPPSPFFPGFAKVPPAGARPEGSLFSPALPVSRRPGPGGHTVPFAASSGLRLLLVPCPQVPAGSLPA